MILKEKILSIALLGCVCCTTLSAQGIKNIVPLQGQNSPKSEKVNPVKLSSYVNPFIGTGGHGHTFPGAVAPFGMVQLSPDTRNDASWDGCGGYYRNDSFILGFSHTHLSGTGVSDFGDILMQPAIAPLFEPNEYKQRFVHETETATAGYYRVFFEEPKIRIELTATERTGFQKITYASNTEQWLIIDLKHRDKLISHSLKFDEFNNQISGHRQSKGWADNQWVYFVSSFSKQIIKHKYNRDSSAVALYFGKMNDPEELDKNLSLVVSTTLSFTSLEGAMANNAFEFNRLRYKDFDEQFMTNSPNFVAFERAKSYVSNLWDSELGRIVISDEAIQYNAPNQHGLKLKSRDEKMKNRRKFYTALYHCFIHPSLASDADGKYRGRDMKIHTADHPYYHVFSLWDTYRTLHPLLNIIQKSRSADFLKTMLLQYRDGGKLPVWELASCETNCMIGFHSVAVFADAINKGVPLDLDTVMLIKALKASSDAKEIDYTYQIPITRELLTLYNLHLGYIDVLKTAESVSKTLEYAYDDWCNSEICRLLSYDSLSKVFLLRSERWKNLFDLQTLSMRPKQNGKWLEPFVKSEVNNYYTEANAWQYNFAVPQNLPDLITAMGGEESFQNQLDSLIYGSDKLSGREQADISGLIGQYAHGNEPSHHLVYLYNYVQKPQKSQQLISKIINEFYENSPEGLIGNEDCGQMSAWYVMSALGFYPVCPGSTEYSLGYPLFPNITIKMEDADDIQINRDLMPNELLWTNAFKEGYFELSEDSVRKNYKVNFGSEFPENLKTLRPSAHFINESYLMIHRRLDFKWKNAVTDLPTNYGKVYQTVGSFEPQVPEITAPKLTNKGEIYRIIVRVSKKTKGYLHFFLRNMDSPVNTDSLGLNQFFTSRAIYNLNEGKSDSSDENTNFYFIKSTGSNLFWTCFAQTSDKTKLREVPFTATYIQERPNNFKVIELKSVYSSQYHGGGKEGLVDGIIGSDNWRAGNWQGYQNQDFEAIVDLGAMTEIKYLGMRFLTDVGAWIYLPKSMEIEYSTDGVEYKKFNGFTFTNFGYEGSQVVPIIVGSKKRSLKARYIRFKAVKYGKLPKGHPGFESNGDAYIFIDELIINPEVMEQLLHR